MSNMQSPRRRPGSRSTFTTKGGNSIKLNRSMGERRRAAKDARARKRAAYLSTLPKNRWKRLAYRLQPRRVAQYWFSREGAIMALKLAGIGVVVCFLLLVGLFAYFRKDLPNITDVSGNNLPGSISYYDRTGKTLLWQDYDAVKRIPVKDSDISPYMKQATVAIEDKDFYHEGAFNVRGISRAAFHDVFNKGGGLQGGSTITQQLVKLNENWTADRTITRKVKEVILAVELEREYSKQDILAGYLNIAPYGGIEYGVESAARDYFHTSAKDLTLAQASMLAAIPQYPTGYSPYSDPHYNPSAGGDFFDQEALLARQHYILDQMVMQHMIPQSQADAAKKVNVLAQVHPLQAKYNGIKAPYFVLAAKHELESKWGAETVQRGGWRITTTLNLKLQKLADSLVQKNLPNVQQYGGDEEAMAAEDIKTGQMVALVGGVDFSNRDHGQINYAQTNISPGSSVKPYDYASLINYSKDAGAGSVLYDTQGPLPGYSCTNNHIPKYDPGANCLWDYDFKYPGPVTLRYGLAGSRNVPAIKAMLTVGTDKVIQTANAMMGDSDGYRCYKPGTDVSTGTKKDEAPCYASSGIGDGAYLHLDEHVNGLATLGRLGQYIPQTYLMQIDNAAGKTIYKWSTPKPKEVLKPDAAFIVNDMLSDPNASYLPYGYKFQHYNGWKFAVKTGTTNDNFDGLMTSWSTQYAVASWVGYHTRNKAMTAGGMEYMTEPLTRGFMEGATDMLHKSPENWQPPTGVKKAPAYIVRTHVGVGSVEPSPATDWVPSWYQPKTTGNTSAIIDKVSGKLATNCTPAAAKQNISNSNANQFSIDKWVDGGGGNSGSYNTNATDDVHNCDDAKPTVNVSISNGGNLADTCEGSCTVTVTVSQGTHALSSGKFPGTVQVQANGKTVKTFKMSGNGSPQTFSFTYKPSSQGTATISATATDSVLYSGSDSTRISVTSGNNNDQGQGPGGG